MLKVTFPHLGNFYIPCKALLNELDLEPVAPPFSSHATTALGCQIAPEFACFPLKVNLGNYIEAINAGAEYIFMAGGIGPCRFGYYGEVQREILKEAGYDIDFLVFEAPKTHPGELWRRIKRIVPRYTLSKLTRALYVFWQKAMAVDKFDRLANKIRPVEQRLGTTSSLQNNFYRSMDNTSSVGEIQKVLNDSLGELKALTVKETGDPIKIVLAGEIYMVLEPRVNFQIERVLGEMGVEVRRTIYLTDWIFEHLCLSIIEPNWHKQLLRLAKPYLGNAVGGHGLETIAHAVEAGVNRFHGVVQLAPFTCMPEIIAMQILPEVSKKLSIPVLTLIIDEHSAETGIATRLEAFIDLIRYGRNQQALSKSGLDAQYVI
jgi:predicted nucleotide-binding protein (sugar kinase/HSP70/actin superfamily)